MSHPQSFFRSLASALALAAIYGLAFGSFAEIPFVKADPSVDSNVESSSRPSSFADVVAAVKPAVVNISTSATRRVARQEFPFPGTPFDDLFRRYRGPAAPRPAPQVVQGMGSGFIVDADGLVVTNYHVIAGADEITVTLDDGTRHPARLKGHDENTDLALLEIDTKESLPYASFGDSDAIRVGDWVVAIGNPFGLGGSATAGILSARGRDIQSGDVDDFLQIDAPINQGNSGGPLFDLSGRVVGVNTAIFSPNGGNVGIGFAIPAERAASIIDQLRDGGEVKRGWLGVSIRSVDHAMARALDLDEGGALIVEVVEDGPAESAGIRPGDVIVALDGEPISDVRELTRHVSRARPEARLQVEVLRRGKRLPIDVALGERPGLR